MNGAGPAVDAEVIPVSIITGFLGSGKTTLLGRLLHKPAMSDSAVIINEFGEIGLDHQLVESVEGDIVVMASGCLCCTIRNSLADTLRDLFEKREAGSIKKFCRVLIETTGLADPAPIIHTLMEDPFVSRYFSLSCVVTTVDALHGDGQLDEHIESVKQAAVADRLILTKTDLAAAHGINNLQQRLRILNPGAPVIVATHGDVDPQDLFDGSLHDLASKIPNIANWLRADAYGPTTDHSHESHHGHTHAANTDANRHDARIQAHCLIFDDPINWRYFSPNLASLVSRHAEKLLRVKGILNVTGEPKPIVVHGVQHHFHRLRLAEWPDADRRSKLVLITRDLDRSFVVQWLQEGALSGPPPV